MICLVKNLIVSLFEKRNFMVHIHVHVNFALWIFPLNSPLSDAHSLSCIRRKLTPRILSTTLPTENIHRRKNVSLFFLRYSSMNILKLFPPPEYNELGCTYTLSFKQPHFPVEPRVAIKIPKLRLKAMKLLSIFGIGAQGC